MILSVFLCIHCAKFSIFYQQKFEKCDKNLTEALFAVIQSQQFSFLRIFGTKNLYTSIESSLHHSNLSHEFLTKENFNSSINTQASYTNVILFANISNTLKILSKENLQYLRLDGFYILLSFGICNETNEKKIFELAWKQQIYNINLICNDNESILMKTFFPYQKEKCGNTDSIVINKFINYSWKNEQMFPSKFANLFNCQLRVASFFYPPITMRQTLENGTYRYYGSEFEILKELSLILNFDINHNYVPKTGSSGLLLDNGTATGILKQTIDGDADILMAFYYLTYQRSKFLSFSHSHYSVPLVIMIPMGRPYSAFEKLFKPFQLVLWSTIILTFALALLTIAIINCQNGGIRRFIFGTKVTNPYMNFLNILMNGVQDVLPKRTFARYLLMVFMLFCLVLRTIYQGSLYQFLQSDDRKPDMERIDEMMKNKFVFYIRETLEHNIKNMSFYNR